MSTGNATGPATVPGRRLARICLLPAAGMAAAGEFARDAGYERVRLWTNDPLLAARRIYLAAGFALLAEETHHSFGVDLVGQTYELDLRTLPGDRPGRVKCT